MFVIGESLILIVFVGYVDRRLIEQGCILFFEYWMRNSSIIFNLTRKVISLSAKALILFIQGVPLHNTMPIVKCDLIQYVRVAEHIFLQWNDQELAAAEALLQPGSNILCMWEI